MQKNDFVRVKKRDQYGIVLFPSKQLPSILGPIHTLNLVLLEDNTHLACGDDDLELINTSFLKEN